MSIFKGFNVTGIDPNQYPVFGVRPESKNKTENFGQSLSLYWMEVREARSKGRRAGG